MDSGFRVLIILKSGEDRRLVEHALESGGASRLRVTAFGSLGAGLEYLGRERADAVLVGLDLPDSRILAALRQLRQAAPGLPAIVLGDWVGADLEAQVLEEGAVDYLAREDWSGGMLVRSVVHAIERYRLQRRAERAVRAAGEAEGAVDDLLGTIGHELLSPLTAMRGALANMRDGVLSGEADELSEYAGLLEAECGRLSGLVEKLLELGLVRSGQERIDFRPGDLRGAADAAIAECAEKARAGGIALRAEWPAVLSAVRADEDLMRRVFVNLIENAIRHTPAGGSVTLEARDRGGEMRFTVTDTGVGVPPRERERIFERFYQVGGGCPCGSGLGLAICREIVALHGGRIWVEDRDRNNQAGSVFAISLPMAGQRETMKV